MTIKEFSNLCGCNPQTIRYYDRMNLLKPVKVDEWTGYRYYDEEQAIDYLKIKNMQSAGFTIDEIKELLSADDETIYDAFSQKISKQEKLLQRMKEIRQSYQREIKDMRQKLEIIRDQVRKQMEGYDPSEEFAIDKESYSQMIDGVTDFFESMISRNDDSDYDYQDYEDSEDGEEEDDFLDFLNNPAYEIVYEKHGWNHVKEYYKEFSKLEDGREYALLFKVEPSKVHDVAFANTMLGMLLKDNPGKKRNLGCNVMHSDDNQNHFWLLKRKSQE